MSNLNYATYSENDSGSPTTPSESYKSLSTQPQPQSQPQPQVPMPGSKHPLMRPKIQDRQRTGLYLICIHPCVTADKQARSPAQAWLTLASSSSRGAGLNVSADGSVIVIDGVIGCERVSSTWTAAAVPLPPPQVVTLMPLCLFFHLCQPSVPSARPSFRKFFRINSSNNNHNCTGR